MSGALEALPFDVRYYHGPGSNATIILGQMDRLYMVGVNKYVLPVGGNQL